MPARGAVSVSGLICSVAGSGCRIWRKRPINQANLAPFGLVVHMNGLYFLVVIMCRTVCTRTDWDIVSEMTCNLLVIHKPLLNLFLFNSN